VGLPAYRRVVESEQQHQCGRRCPEPRSYYGSAQDEQQQPKCGAGDQRQRPHREEGWSTCSGEQCCVQVDEPWRVQRLEVPKRHLAMEDPDALLCEVALVEVVDADSQDGELRYQAEDDGT